MSYYETDEQVDQYMEFHYGDTWLSVANYPKACAEHCLALMAQAGLAQEQPKRALDLGCAVGRTSLELALAFEEVVAVDLSQRFIQQAQQLQSEGSDGYFRRYQGELGQTRQVDLAALGLQEAASRVTFAQGDAGNLDPQFGAFDLVFAGNLIDRLPDPGQFLRQIKQHVRPGGLLVISSPYTLLTDFTPREKWIGGFMAGEQEVTMLDGMGACLEPWFEPVSKPVDLPFVIRETGRKFQHSFAQLSAWRRF
ncbi:MAG: putative 4-mercaptohistidine N1-methyltransferase [Halomonadaceae bacterium]|nr:MAG: putative 4-mercaptohistidine N1-methyltransferase [Halomonadaceae bacterium]